MDGAVDLIHGQILALRGLGQRLTGRLILQLCDETGMACGVGAPAHEGLHIVAGEGQGEHIAHPAVRFAGAAGDVALGPAKLFIHLADGEGGFEGGEVFALHVLHQRDGQQGVVIPIGMEIDGDLLDAGGFGGGQAAGAIGELDAAFLQTAVERADETMLAHGLDQFGDINLLTGVEGVRVNVLDAHIGELGMGTGANEALNGLVLAVEETSAAQGRRLLFTLFRHV